VLHEQTKESHQRRIHTLGLSGPAGVRRLRPRRLTAEGEVERLAIIARLKEGAADQAAAIVRHGPPFDPGENGFERHAVYLSGDHVIFLFEGEGADRNVRDLLSDSVRSDALAAWGPLLDEMPQLAVEGYYWRRTG
jgi:hypothetical protein